jgi:hypothetical protein
MARGGHRAPVHRRVPLPTIFVSSRLLQKIKKLAILFPCSAEIYKRSSRLTGTGSPLDRLLCPPGPSEHRCVLA